MRRNGFGKCGIVAALLLCGCGDVISVKPQEPAQAPKVGVYYVATDGNDAWSGTLPAPNRTRTDGPFATMARARDAIRALKQSQGGTLEQPASVRVRGGTYFLSEPLALGPEDSGTAACPVTYEAFGDERPVFSGGQVIAGWRERKQGVWSTTLSHVRDGKWVFRQLFVKRKGQQAFERRYRPCVGPFIIAGLTDSPTWKTTMRHRQSQRDFLYAAGDIRPDWSNRSDVEVVAFHDWSSSRLRIESIDDKKRVVTFTGWPVYRVGHWYKGGRNPYFVENVKEAFGQPGEWYLDRPTGVLSYRPAAGEKMADLTVVAPRAEQLLRLVGRAAVAADAKSGEGAQPPACVEHVRFRGIAFEHTGWELPAKGYSSGQGMIGLPAAVHLEYARQCAFERCTMAHLGAYAVRLGQGSHHNSIVGCQMVDLGAGGVLVGVTDRKAKAPVLPTHNTVSNCVISDGGRVHFSPHGIWVGIAQHTAIRHCVVRRFPYSNISAGWCWDDKASSAGNTVIENCHIHDAMQLLADGGAIYSLGWQPGNAIRGNHIHHVGRSPFAGRAPNNGIFFDQGSKAWHVESNVFHSNAEPHIRYNQCKQDWQTWGTNYVDVKPDDPKCPPEAKAIVAKAGLEPAYRHLDSTHAAPLPPVLARPLPPPPPPPPPKPIRDDFESTAVGRPPRFAQLGGAEKPARIAVTDEAAASGKHSLKITDAAGLKKPFYPYLYYVPGYTKGAATAELAVRVEKGARLTIEAREEAHVPTGIHVAVSGDGKLSAGKASMAVPVGQWVKVTLALRLGEQADGTYDLSVTLPDGKTRHFRKLAVRKYRRFGALMITSSATVNAVAYLDDVRLTPSPLEATR